MTLFISLEDHEGLSGGPIEDPGVEMKPMGGGHTDPDVVDQATLAVAEAKGDVESERETVQEIAEAIDALESYKALLNETLENGGVDLYTQKAIKIGVESMVSKFDIQTGLESIVSMENIHTASGKMTATYASLESLEIALEGLWDKFKNTIKNVFKKIGNFFKSISDRSGSFKARAKGYIQRVNNPNTVLKCDAKDEDGNDKFPTINIPVMDLEKDGEINVVKLIESAVRFKHDIVDSGEVRKYYDNITAILTSKKLDNDDMVPLVKHVPIKLPSYFEPGDKFGLMEKRTESINPYTWSITDTVGVTIAVPDGKPKGLSIYSVAGSDYKPNKNRTKIDVPPLTRAEIEKACEGIIQYSEGFNQIKGPLIQTIQDFEDIQNGLLEEGREAIEEVKQLKDKIRKQEAEMERLKKQNSNGNGFNSAFENYSNEGFFSNATAEYKDLLQRFTFLIIIARLGMGIADFFTPGFPLTASVLRAVRLNGFVNDMISKIGTYEGQLMGFRLTMFVTHTAVIHALVYLIAMLITSIKYLRMSGKSDPALEEEYEAYVNEYNLMPPTMKAHFIDPTDFDTAIEKISNDKSRSEYEMVITGASEYVVSMVTNFQYDLIDFSFHTTYDLFDLIFQYIENSIYQR